MQFKKGKGWKACYDAETGRYTAETSGPGSYNLYEITKETWEKVGTKEKSDRDSYRLISDGRHLYMDVNDRCGPPYTVVLDSDYPVLCPWASIVSSDHVWSEELTYAAVELFASEKENREQRRKKRETREENKKD